MCLFVLPILILAMFLSFISTKKSPLFLQERIGKNKKKFVMYKIRTMTVTETRGHFVAVKKDDDRVPYLCKFIRKLHLDELPQLWNIYKGDMNFIGPRPYPTIMDKKYLNKFPLWKKRYSLKPGITGLAQSLGNKGGDSENVFKQRLALDLYYIRKKNLCLDLFIIINTISILIPFSGKLRKNDES